MTQSSEYRHRTRLIAAALLVLLIAILSGLYVILWIAPDYAAPYAAAIFLLSGLGIWLVGRQNQNFRIWRLAFERNWQEIQAQQQSDRANAGQPRVRRLTRLIGLLMVVAGLVVGVAVAAAVWLGDLRIYAFVVTIPLAVFAIGTWFLITGRYPGGGEK